MSAIISKNGLYRYWLERELSGGKSTCVFVMLNPSTADAKLDDPTIRRCISFGERLQCGKLVVVNLFAFRATKPVDLYKARDPIGPENDKYLHKALNLPGVIICGWGANKTMGRDDRIKELATRSNVNLCCLGKTAKGAPRHPLFVHGSAPLETL